MPRTRSLETYPNQAFWALIQRIIAEGGFTVPCSRSQAASMRGEIYAWRRACEGGQERATQFGINVGKLREVAFRIDDTGLVGVLASELMTPSLITNALGGNLPALKSAAQQALDRMREAGLVPLGENGGS